MPSTTQTAPLSSASRQTQTSSRRTWWMETVGALGSGVLMAFAFPPYDWGNLVWVALLPLLTILWRGEKSRKRLFALGWLYGMGWYGVSFWWIHEVGYVFQIPQPLFLAIAFFPLMALYSCLPGLWALGAGWFLRPRLENAPRLQTDAPRDAVKREWDSWATRDLLSTVRSAVGCGALWVCIEWLRAQGTLGFSWNSLGMALFDGLSFVQWAEFVGTSALSFIPVFMSVILWGAFRRTVMYFRGAGSGCRPWDFYGAVVILFGLFVGGLVLSKENSASVMLRRENVMPLPVLAVQINKDQSEHIEEMRSPYRHEAAVAQYHAYLNATVQAYTEIARNTMLHAQENEDFGLTLQLPVWVVWPESALPYPFVRSETTGQLLPQYMGPATAPLLGEEGLPLARKRVGELGAPGLVLLTGGDELLLRQEGNQALIAGMLNSLICVPDGMQSIVSASKQHLMPFGEYIPLAQDIEWIGKLYSQITGTQVGDGIRPGKGGEPILIPVPGTDLSVGVIPAICYEDTVGNLLRRFVRRGPQIIVNVTNDAWFRDSSCGIQQARAAAFRCIELRRPMVRAANKGVCCAIAPNGAAVHALTKADGSPHLSGFSYAVLPLDTHAGMTLYALMGDWAVALSLLICALLSRFRRSTT